MRGRITLIDKITNIDVYDKNQGVELRIMDPDRQVIRNIVFQDKIPFMFTAEKSSQYKNF